AAAQQSRWLRATHCSIAGSSVHIGASPWKASTMLRFSCTTSIRMVLTRNGNTISDLLFRSKDHVCRRRGLPICYEQNNDLNRGRDWRWFAISPTDEESLAAC